MPPETTKILLVEDNPGDARVIQEMLAEARDHNFEIDWVTSLSQAKASVNGGGIDLVILDLGLPDSQGLDTFTRAYQHGSHLPFLVLTGLADENLGVTAVRQGAQDYLVKGEVTSRFLDRAIRYAIERKRNEAALEAERKRLFALLNHLPAVIYLKNSDFKILFANRLFREIFGDPGNRPCYEVTQGRNAPCENCTALEVLKTGVLNKLESPESVKGRIFESYNYPFYPSDGSRLILTLSIDITERKQAEEEIRRQRDQLRALAARLAEVEELERQQLARELHDQVCQNLAGINIALRTIKIMAHREPLDQLLSRLAHIGAVAEQTGEITREIMEGLRPTVLDRYGLMEGLRQLGKQFSQLTGIDLEILGEGAVPRLKPNVELALFRIAQEALNNVAKHAMASHVALSTKVDQESVHLVIADNGTGFDQHVMAHSKNSRGWGLMTMTERAMGVGGHYRIESQPGQGTRVVVEVPR